MGPWGDTEGDTFSNLQGAALKDTRYFPRALPTPYILQIKVLNDDDYVERDQFKNMEGWNNYNSAFTSIEHVHISTVMNG